VQIWRKSSRDGLLLAYSMAQLLGTIYIAVSWDHSSLPVRVIGFLVLVFMMTYNIIVISHLFVHNPWFTAPVLNSIVSVLNSLNIGQSVQTYQLTHARNHHRYNNDPRGINGETKDTSSTYRMGINGDHARLLPYIFDGSLSSLVIRGKEFLAVSRLWRVGPHETQLLSLATRMPQRRRRELRQIQLDRCAYSLELVMLLVASWQWTLICYLPAFFIALTLVNVQNYYRHYGARPGDRAADSVSYYGKVYNFLTFNDGYHQEHHLQPNAHWSQLPEVRQRYRERLDSATRIISPVPAMLGFLHYRRPLLHREDGQFAVKVKL
jgi:fatty acid desaturase